MTSIKNIPVKESFRDSVATISKDGKRNYIHPKKPVGKFYNLRSWFSVFYLIVFFTLPFIKVNGAPLLMINILERKFILFGLIFWPQDFFIFGIGMVTFIVFVILFTVVFGRVFCGWACPQTIFMEMVFRKIEYWIDGDATKQKQLKAMPWNANKIKKRGIKFILFFLLSFLVANFFLAYLIGMDELLGYVKDPAAHTATLISLLAFTLVFFFVYWWFREQVCIVVCPYGRLQGVLLDKNSIVVAYDYVRGEPRKKLARQKDHDTGDHEKCAGCKGNSSCKNLPTTFLPELKTGDCIDCNACVRVCPTGIDIRNGTQLECINCTACMDACDAIMTSIHKPTGLIKYGSWNSIANNVQLKFTPRIKAYTAVLTLLISLLVFLLISRSDLDATLMRTAGMTYTSLPDGRIENLYSLKLANKTHKDIAISLRLENIEGEIVLVGSSTPVVKKEDYNNLQFLIKLNRNDVKGWKTALEIGLYQDNKKIKSISAKFIGPEVYE
ncbi:MAG: cytochrome c oxidase accessory protein CcoG [Ferruginibacter sp.]